MKKMYDVVICEDETGKIVSIIGTNLNESKMEHRIATGIMRCNMAKYHVVGVEAGSKKIG